MGCENCKNCKGAVCGNSEFGETSRMSMFRLWVMIFGYFVILSPLSSLLSPHIHPKGKMLLDFKQTRYTRRKFHGHRPGGDGKRTNCLMLAPLDTIKRHPLLHQLPQRTQFPQETYPLPHSLHHVVDLVFCREPPDAEPDTAVCAFVAVAERPEDVAGFERGGRARASG